MAEEREYVVPLRRGFRRTPKHERAKKASTVLRSFLERHCKAEIRIGQHLNEAVWARGMRSPPPRVAVLCTITEKDGKRIADVELLGKKFKESVRPEEKVEEATGLKGKLQKATSVLGGKKGDDAKESTDTPAETKPKAEKPAKADTPVEKADKN